MTKFENEFDLITAIKDGDHNAYSYLFSKYYKDLVLYGGTIIPNQEICEDIVQNIFIYIWENRKNIKIDSLKSYLIRAVRNSCLDEIKHNKIMNEYSTFILTQNNIFNNDTEEYILYSELNIQIQQAIQKLPVDERTAFEMSKIKGIKYQQIADELNISVRTVDVRISKSLKRLKLLLKDFFVILFIFTKL